MVQTEGKVAGSVRKAQHAIRSQLEGDPFGHQRVRRQCELRNPYILDWLHARGLDYRDGLICDLKVDCPTCEGSGRLHARPGWLRPCETCHGSGEVTHTRAKEVEQECL
jgi:hypothetical protein